MNYIHKIMENVFGKMKLYTAPELDLDESVFLKSESYSIKINQNSSHCKNKWVQDRNK